MWPQRSACLRFLQPEESRPGLDDGDLGTEAGERLAELHADGASAKLSGDCGLAVGPVIDSVEARNRRDRCRAPVRDHHGLAGVISLASDLDGAVVDELALAAHELCARCFERRRRARVVEVARHPDDAFRDLREIELPLHARGGQVASATRLGQRLARSQERF